MSPEDCLLNALVTATARHCKPRSGADSSGLHYAVAFDAGEELSEHTAPFDALVLTLSGALEARKVELQSRVDAPDMPELLHPRIADVYRENVGSLCRALASEQSRTGARDAIRALVETILLEPDGEKLKITLKGDLAGTLSAARDSKRSPDTGDLMVQIKLVAGARNQRYLQLWSSAA